MDEPKRKVVMTDFDGVIADTFDIASTMAHHFCLQMTPERYREAFEGNIHDSYERDLPGDHSRCHHPSDTEWFEEFGRRGAGDAKPFAGVGEAFQRIANEYTMAVVTSSADEYVRPTLARLGILESIADVLDYRVHKSKVEKMRMLMEKYGVLPFDCVFITDTLGDIREAEEHQIGVIGCSWGFHSHETLTRGVPFRIVDAPSQLPDAVNDFFARS